jgi:hypothetical protein
MHARVIARGGAFYKMTRAGLLPVGGGFDALVTHAMHVERSRRLLAELEEETHLRSRTAQLARDLERVARDRVSRQPAQRRWMPRASRWTTSVAVRRLRQALSRRRPARRIRRGLRRGGLPPRLRHRRLRGGARAPAVPHRRPRRGSPRASRRDRRARARDPRAVGTVVRAVFGGRVAFADRYGPYGRIVILDHGDHYYTVSGNLDESRRARSGRSSAPGSASAPSATTAQGPMLYFEVRHGSQTIAPGAWLGL